MIYIEKKNSIIIECIFLFLILLGFITDKVFFVLALIFSPFFIIKVMFKYILYRWNYLIKNKKFIFLKSRIIDFIIFSIYSDLGYEIENFKNNYEKNSDDK